MAILIPEQISILRKREQELLKVYEDYKDYLKSRETICSEGVSISQVGDHITEMQYQQDLTELDDVRDVLRRATYVTQRPIEEVGIGTKFILRFDGDDETNSVILTDCSYGMSKLYHLISKDSPVGAAVIGKKSQEPFSATVIDQRNNSKHTITGVVENIIADPNEYTHFIREKVNSCRICRAAKDERQRINALPLEEQVIANQERTSITPSQLELLLLEKERLTSQRWTPSISGRLSEINKVLKNAKVVTPPTDGTIGIGTTFDLLIADGETAKDARYEMINHAVSHELDDSYIERISSLGYKLFGLKAGDSVSFIKNRKTYTAQVTNVVKPTKEMTPTQLLKK